MKEKINVIFFDIGKSLTFNIFLKREKIYGLVKNLLHFLYKKRDFIYGKTPRRDFIYQKTCLYFSLKETVIYIYTLRE